MSDFEAIDRLVSQDQFQSIERAFETHYDFPLEMTDLNGEMVKGYSSDCQRGFCDILLGNKLCRKRCVQDRVRSMHMAFETGQPYTTLCHAGIILSCVPVMDGDVPLGGVFCAKCLSEPFSDTIREDIDKRLIGLKLDRKKLWSAAEILPVHSAREIHEAIEFLFILLYEKLQLDPHVIEWRRNQTLQQAEIGEAIQSRKITGLDEKYPFKTERELLAKVRVGDQTGAREILNSLLGEILFRNPGQVNILKVRLVELLGILSRSASEAGVDPDLLLEKNAEYINKVLSLETQEEICTWISLALNDFIEMVYSQLSQKHDNRLLPAMEYMQKHYREKLLLEDIASSAHFSVSRLCHLFRERLGFTVFDYLTELRLSRAKYQLLASGCTCLEVSLDSGFANLSYFNRIFKRETGMTPTQFRKQNKR